MSVQKLARDARRALARDQYVFALIPNGSGRDGADRVRITRVWVRKGRLMGYRLSAGSWMPVHAIEVVR